MANTECITDESWLWVVFGSKSKSWKFLVGMVACLQDDSQCSILPGILTLCIPLSHCTRVGLWPVGYGRSDGAWLAVLGYTVTVASILVVHSQLFALGKHLTSKEQPLWLSTSAVELRLLTTARWVSLEIKSPTQRDLCMTMAPAWPQHHRRFWTWVMTLSHSQNPFHDRPSDTVWDNKCWLS